MRLDLSSIGHIAAVPDHPARASTTGDLGFIAAARNRSLSELAHMASLAGFPLPVAYADGTALYLIGDVERFLATRTSN